MVGNQRFCAIMTIRLMHAWLPACYCIYNKHGYGYSYTRDGGILYNNNTFSRQPPDSPQTLYCNNTRQWRTLFVDETDVKARTREKEIILSPGKFAPS